MIVVRGLLTMVWIIITWAWIYAPMDGDLAMAWFVFGTITVVSYRTVLRVPAGHRKQ